MELRPQSAVRRPQSRFKYVLFSALGAMFLFVLWHNEGFIIDHSHSDWITTSLSAGCLFRTVLAD
jgi:hypothetical protein